MGKRAYKQDVYVCARVCGQGMWLPIYVGFFSGRSWTWCEDGSCDIPFMLRTGDKRVENPEENSVDATVIFGLEVSLSMIYVYKINK